MRYVYASTRGRVTIPADIRRQLGIGPGSRVTVSVQDDEIVLRREGNVMDANGALREYAKGDAEDWEAVRTEMEKAVAEEVDDAGGR